MCTVELVDWDSCSVPLTACRECKGSWASSIQPVAAALDRQVVGAVCSDAFEAAMDVRYTISFVAPRMFVGLRIFIVESRLGTVKEYAAVVRHIRGCHISQHRTVAQATRAKNDESVLAAKTALICRAKPSAGIGL
jgi:hypothetical protein